MIPVQIFSNPQHPGLRRFDHMTADIILIAYGLFLVLGGFLGFKKGSKVSLIMGLSSGILVLLGVWFLTIDPQPAWIFLTCLNVLLAVSFALRLVKTRKFMPSGMLLSITLAVLIFCLAHLGIHA
jgi:uncharacterized membrane protein (UPF0136 family)